MYYLEDLRENTMTPPPPAALLPTPPNEPLPVQKSSQDIKIPIGVEKEKNGVVVVSWTEEKAKEKEKGKGKEKEQNKSDVNPSEDALTIGDMVSKVKVAGSKSKIDSKKDSRQS